MVSLEKVKIYNFYDAFMGCRNSWKSWEKSDSKERLTAFDKEIEMYNFIEFGEEDLELFKALVKGGSSERKFLRQINVSFKLTAPLYWWKQFDQYRINVTSNAESTMHRVAKDRLDISNFSLDFGFEVDDLIAMNRFHNYISFINTMIEDYNEEGQGAIEKKKLFRMINQFLPQSYNQMRTITCNYENLLNMYFQRKNHKLLEWRQFCEQIKTFPHMKEIIECLED